MLRLATISLLPFWLMTANAATSECSRPLGPAVPDIVTARKIAQVVIAAQRPAKIDYSLTVESDPEEAGHWIAYQSPPQPRDKSPDTITVIHGGGGISMRINKCSGEISDMHYQR